MTNFFSILWGLGKGYTVYCFAEFGNGFRGVSGIFKCKYSYLCQIKKILYRLLISSSL